MTEATPTTAQTDHYIAMSATLAAYVAEHPEAAPMLRDVVTGLAARAEYPALTVAEEEDPEDPEERRTVVRCPWCGQSVADSWEGLTVVDTADRWTSVAPEEWDTAAGVIHPDYDGHGDYDGVNYMHGACGRPVNLPAGWSEE